MDYIIRKIKINLNRKAEYNKIPIVIYADELIFGIKAKNTCQFKIELLEAPEDICLHDGQLHKQDIPKKNINIVVSVPLKQQLEKENLIVK